MNYQKIAIYSRKSKYTQTGTSTQNQIEMCQNYLVNKFGPDILNHTVIFEDEGFTGANTNRPEFQKMLQEFQTGTYQMLVVYRLDRISRNVFDFCSLKDTLSNLNIDFCSITENFDTSTPLGSAMIMISSVFAQLERDTIAERVKDNMTELAKTGRWLGGTTPLGFKSIAKKNKQNKIYYELKPIDKEQTTVKLIFTEYLKKKSLTKLENYLKKANITTRQKKNFSKVALKEILNNIVYCKSDKDILNYLKEKNIQIYTSKNINPQKSFLSYNKRKIKKLSNGKVSKNIYKDPHQWIIATANHPGLIDGLTWIKVQKLLNQKQANYSNNTKISALLKNILICKYCQTKMKAKILKTTNPNGERNFTYYCPNKNCPEKNFSGIKLDTIILEQITKINIPNKAILNNLKKLYPHNKNISKNNLLKKEIKNLLQNPFASLNNFEKKELFSHLIAKVSYNDLKIFITYKS